MANEEYNTNTEINDYLTVATDAVTGVTGLGDGPTGGGGGTTIVRCVDGSINTSTSGNICTISVSSNYLKKTDADSKYATRTDLTSNYVSKTDAASTYAAKTDLTGKQDKLTAGSNISIVGNVISATGGGSGTSYIAGNGINISGNTISADTSVVATKTDLSGKQDTLTAGQNISIVGNVISATGGGNNDGIVTLNPGDSLQEAIANGATVINLIGGKTYSGWQGLTINKAITIHGNGADIEFPDKSTHGFLITAEGCKFYDINFKGSSAAGDVYDTYSDYWAIKVKIAQYQHFVGCSFDKFMGGIGMVSANGQDSDYYNGGTNIDSCFFSNCFCGNYRVGRFEFGRDMNNRYYKCVIAIFDMAGNWTTIGTKATACRHPYITADWVMKFSAAGTAAASANNGHGTLIGCEFNHANNMSPFHSNTTIQMQSGSTKNLANGVWFDGSRVQPPTTVGLTCYYCNVNISADAQGYDSDRAPIRMSGIVASNMSFNNNSTIAPLVIGDLVKRANVTLNGTIHVIDYNTQPTTDTTDVEEKLEALHDKIKLLQTAIKQYHPDAIVDVVKEWLLAVDYPQLITAFKGGSLQSDGSFNTADDSTNSGILFPGADGIELDIDSSAPEFTSFGLVCATQDDKVWAVNQGWAARDSTQRESWSLVAGGDWTINSKGTVASGINWPGNYTVAPGAHIRLEKVEAGMKYTVTYPDGVHGGNSSNYHTKEVILQLPGGTFTPGIIHANGTSKTGKLINIKVYTTEPST